MTIGVIVDSCYKPTQESTNLPPTRIHLSTNLPVKRVHILFTVSADGFTRVGVKLLFSALACMKK